MRGVNYPTPGKSRVATKAHPQVIEAPGFQYVGDGMHSLRSNINNVPNSPGGLTFTTASLFALSGDFF